MSKRPGALAPSLLDSHRAHAPPVSNWKPENGRTKAPAEGPGQKPDDRRYANASKAHDSTQGSRSHRVVSGAADAAIPSRSAPGGATCNLLAGAVRPAVLGGESEEGGRASGPPWHKKSKVGRSSGAEGGHAAAPERDSVAARVRRRGRFTLQGVAAGLAPELVGLQRCLRVPVGPQRPAMRPPTEREAANLAAGLTRAGKKRSRPRRFLDETDGHGEVAVAVGAHGAGYHGLQRCASVWACPCCAPRIAEVRAQEIESGISAHVGRLSCDPGEGEVFGGEAATSVALVTLTMRHRRGESLALLLEALRSANKRLKQHRRWKGAKAVLRGTITALEVTHGEAAGWHPHLHLVVLGRVTGRAFLRVLASLRAAWRGALQAEGRDCGRAGFDVSMRRGDAARYVAKLGREATGIGLKRARQEGSRTAWQLLADAADGDAQASELWSEYAQATKGRRWLSWSHRLKADLGVTEVTDEDAANPDESDGVVVARLDRHDWGAVVAAALRGDVLDAAEADGEEGVRRVVARAHRLCADTWTRGRRRPPWLKLHIRHQPSVIQECAL